MPKQYQSCYALFTSPFGVSHDWETASKVALKHPDDSKFNVYMRRCHIHDRTSLVWFSKAEAYEAESRFLAINSGTIDFTPARAFIFSMRCSTVRANTPGLIVPTVSPEIQYFTLLINLFTLYILIPLGLFAGVESPLEGGARSLPSGQTPRYIHYGLLGSSMAIAAGFVSILVSQDEEEKIVIGEPLPSHMAAMMQTIPSGKEGRVGNIIVRPSATVRNKRGQHCRSFTAVAETISVAVACRQNGQWITTFAAINNSERILEESRMAHFKAIGASSPFSEEGERLTLGFQ
ncbi:hypothetical protein [Rhizobium sp. GR12]|uniref:hypothetical protein n=1 Tax=Rhizobium sp. GR12 TaxID=3053925 RepID=UPI002FBDD1A3